MSDLSTVMPRYESYKDSGVEWLGEIPSYWQVNPGLVALREERRGNKGMRESQVLSLSYGKIIVKAEDKLVGLVPESFETYQIVKPGDIIIRCTDLQNDKTSLRTGLVEKQGIITSAYLNLRPKSGFDSKFLHYFLHSLDITKVIYKLGSGLRQNLSYIDFKRLPILDIPLEEQTAIATFLDCKTAQIEQAVSIKEQQIALLKERKQILIQNAVTRGLNSDAPMRDSGVEWIGEIPAHWDVVTTKRLTKKVTDGEHISPIFTDSGMPFLSAKDVRENGIVFPNNKFVSIRDGNKFRERCNPQNGDILLVSRGATIGRVTQVRTDVEFCLLGSVILIKPNFDKVCGNFLMYAMGSPMLQSEFLNTSHHSAQQAIYLVKVSSVKLPVPPTNEQVAIVTHIETESAKIDKGITLLEQQITKLKEYKATLINSAVTGKIKVPGVEEPACKEVKEEEVA